MWASCRSRGGRDPVVLYQEGAFYAIFRSKLVEEALSLLASSRDRAIIPMMRRASARVSSSFQERLAMVMISWFAVIASTVAVIVVVLVVLRITLGSSRYGRKYDHEVRRLQIRVADRPEAEARDDSDSESTT